MFRNLVDLRTIVGKHNPVKGSIVSILANHNDGTILSWGFVRALTGTALRNNNKRKRSGNQTDIHAEADALTALLSSSSTPLPEMKNVTVYISSAPCQACFAMIVNAGIKRVMYPQPRTTDYYQSHRSHNTRIAACNQVQVIETAHALPPYRPVDTEAFLQKLPDLPRTWAGGTSPFVERKFGRDDEACSAAKNNNNNNNNNNNSEETTKSNEKKTRNK